ncbi:hypothetical protein COBT_000978 [Conglomerata obtusa]
MKIILKFKGKIYEVEAEECDTIEKLKTKLEELSYEEHKIGAKEMKFIAAGKILKDEQTLKEYKIVDQSQIFVSGNIQRPAVKEPSHINNEVRVPPKQPAPAPTHTPMFDNSALENMMNQQFELIQKDPEALEKQLSPMLVGMPEQDKKKWIDAFIENLKMMKDNPEMMRTAIEQFNSMDPKVMQNMMGSAGLGGFNQPSMQQHFTPNIQQPQVFAQYKPSNFPLPSPTIPCSHGYYPYGYQLPSSPVISQQPIDYNDLFQVQLKQLEEMNFTNRELNLKCLIKANGDVNLAIDYILQETNK